MNKKKEILIIDDSGSSLQLLEYLLENEGYQTFSAESVNAAISILSQHTPDLILLDLQMPEISGYDFLKMRDKLNILKVPIIVISAYDTRENVQLTKSLGASDFLSKPIKTDFLIQLIQSYF